jgi:hypothetical protein
MTVDLTLDGSSFYADLARRHALMLVSARLGTLLATEPDTAAYDDLLARVMSEGLDEHGEDADPLVWAHLVAALATFAAAGLRMAEVGGDVEAVEILRRTELYIEQNGDLSI